MQTRKIIGFILKLPLILMVLASFFVGIYAYVVGTYNITLATPIILGVIICLYLFGVYLSKNKKSGKAEVNDKEKIKK